MQNSDLAKRLADADETERKNRESEIRFTSDLENLRQQEQQLKETLKTEFNVDSIDELRQLYTRSIREDERAVQEREETVNQRKLVIESVQSAVDRVNAQSRG